jgi:hypothetical protein
MLAKSQNILPSATSNKSKQVYFLFAKSKTFWLLTSLSAAAKGMINGNLSLAKSRNILHF